MREQIEAMKQIWTNDAAEYHGQIIDFAAMQTIDEDGLAGSSPRSWHEL